ncbi:MAG: NAD-dependent epimerase/dehydratase family protein [Chitinophagales bacterium]|nr:NAD-dependent epimerase/dehydratase family protein [Chitinophagales bacterium]
MIVITGASGFIASVLLAYLNEQNRTDIILVDNFDLPHKFQNIAWKRYEKMIRRNEIRNFLSNHTSQVEAIIHLGAKAGYIHDSWDALKDDYTKEFRWYWNFCIENQKSFIYASTGAVYGSGAFGFKDDLATSLRLTPQHPYAQIKLETDNWCLSQESQPPFWAGLRISNVYGPNEYHKGENASIIHKAYNEILLGGKKKLFASARPDFEDGSMVRDYIYVKDVAKVISFLLFHTNISGIYNVGSGVGTTYKEAINQVFTMLEITPQYEFVEIREELKNTFPYYTKLDISKLQEAGYQEDFFSIEKGIKEYIVRYLKRGEFY